jgi:acetyl/propionyl-CoA carboxylase alpha subunit
MYFEAKVLDKNYSVDVNETKTHWKIGIKESVSGKWDYYDILKSDFQTIDNAVSFLFQGSSYLVDVFGGGNEYNIFTRGSYRSIKIYNDESLLHESLTSSSGFGHGDQLTAGMPGKIVKIFVKPGDEVKANDPLLIMEAMKMENEMRAAHNEKIKDVMVKPGDSVDAGVVLITYER